MKVIQVEQNTPEWLELRQGKITGSKLNDIVVFKGAAKKIGFYQLIADRLATEPDGSSSRDYGHENEAKAINYFEQISGKKVEKDCGLWVSDINDNIAISPDGGILDEVGLFTEAVEAKNYGPAHHVKKLIENTLDTKERLQAIQYFVVNDKLKKLYFVFYDARITAHPYHCIEVTRKDVAEEVKFYIDYETKTLKEVDSWVERLAF